MRLPWRAVEVPGGDPISTSLTSAEIQALSQLAAGCSVVEVGSAYGYSAVCMVQAGAEFVVAVDPHAGENANSGPVMRENVESRGLESRVHMLTTTSRAALPLLRDGMVDVMFIDGDHSEAGVRFDVRQAWRIVRHGGYVCCHDYGEESCPGVRVALDALHPKGPSRLVDTLAVYLRS